MTFPSPVELRTPELDWGRSDIEQRMLFPGGRFTKVNALLSGLLAGLLPVESGQFQTVVSAMMQGYNEPASLEHDH